MEHLDDGILDDLDFRREKKNVVFASFGKRAAAYVIDIFLLNIVSIPVHAIFGETQGILIGLLMTLLYFSILESSEKQATFGKQMLRIKVTNLNLERPAFFQCIGRHFAKLVSVVIFFIGFFMVLFTENKQALHDMIVQTYVIEE